MTEPAGIFRYLGPRSPLGPGVAGFFCVVLTALAVLILAPIVVKVTAWWWSLWLP